MIFWTIPWNYGQFSFVVLHSAMGLFSKSVSKLRNWLVTPRPSASRLAFTAARIHSLKTVPIRENIIWQSVKFTHREYIFIFGVS